MIAQAMVDKVNTILRRELEAMDRNGENEDQAPSITQDLEPQVFTIVTKIYTKALQGLMMKSVCLKAIIIARLNPLL
jgi:hypothetical protein